MPFVCQRECKIIITKSWKNLFDHWHQRLKPLSEHVPGIIIHWVRDVRIDPCIHARSFLLEKLAHLLEELVPTPSPRSTHSCKIHERMSWWQKWQPWKWHLYFGVLKADLEVINSEGFLLRLGVGRLIINLRSLHKDWEDFPFSRRRRSDEVGAECQAVTELSSFSGLKDGNLFSRLQIKEDAPGGWHLVPPRSANGCSQGGLGHLMEDWSTSFMLGCKDERSWHKVVVDVFEGVNDGSERNLVGAVGSLRNCELSPAYVKGSNSWLSSDDDAFHWSVLISHFPLNIAVVLDCTDGHMGVKHPLMLCKPGFYPVEQVVEVPGCYLWNLGLVFHVSGPQFFSCSRAWHYSTSPVLPQM